MVKSDSPIFKNLPLQSSAMLMTVAARASAHVTVPDLEFHDVYAGHIVKKLPVDLKAYGNDILLVRSIALRASVFDMVTSNFIKNNPDAVIVNLGCGLCSRGIRMRDKFNDSNRFRWFDVDVPEVIEIRRKYIDEKFGTSIAAKIDNVSWLNSIDTNSDSRLLLLMEGVASYLQQNKIESFLIKLGAMANKAGIAGELLLDYIHPGLVGSENMRKKFGYSYVKYHSGFTDADAIRKLHPSFQPKRDYPIFPEVSIHHAMFEMTFQAHNKGRSPYYISHFSLKPSI